MRGLACVALLFAFSFTLGHGIHESTFGRGLKARASSRSSAESRSTHRGGHSNANSRATSFGGYASAIAIASSESVTKVENELVTFFKAFEVKKVPVYNDGSDKKAYCADVYTYIDKELKAVGSVVASVYSEAIGDVIVEGDGEACADAETSGKAEAVGFAEILVDAYVKATNIRTKAKATAIVKQKNTFFVSAFAEAYSSACIEGEGDAFAVQTVFAEAIAEPIATLALFLFAEVDCSGEEGYAESFVDAENTAKESVNVDATSDSGVNGKGDAVADGGGDAFSKQLPYPKCSGLKQICCKNDFINKGKCTCTLSKNGRGRCNGRKSIDKNGPIKWNFDSESCYCL
eukprot:g5693.t1